MHSRVKNQGCLMMNITNEGASYEYLPMEDKHESKSFAICLSGLDVSSADAFAYSLGRSLASSAASAGVGLLASEAGLGGFVSTLAASLAGAYVNSEVMPQMREDEHHSDAEHCTTDSGSSQRGSTSCALKQTERHLAGLSSNSSVSYDHNGEGFRAINVDFDKTELNKLLNDIKTEIFGKALDERATPEEVVERIEVIGEWAEESFEETQNEGISQVETTDIVRKRVNTLKNVTQRVKQREAAEKTQLPTQQITPIVVDTNLTEEQLTESEAYEHLIKHDLKKLSADPTNESLLRRARITMDSYIAEYPRMAKLFGETLRWGSDGYVAAGVTTVALGAAGVTSAPTITVAAVFACSVYLVDRASQILGEAVHQGIEKVAEWKARRETSNPQQQSELKQDYSFAGLMSLSLMGVLKPTVSKFNSFCDVIRVAPEKTLAECSAVELGIKMAEHQYKHNPSFGHVAGTQSHKGALDLSKKLQKKYGELFGFTKDDIRFEAKFFQGKFKSDKGSAEVFPSFGYSQYDVISEREGVILDYKFFSSDRPSGALFGKNRLTRMIQNAPDYVNSIYGIKPIFVNGVHTGKFEAVKVWDRSWK